MVLLFGGLLKYNLVGFSGKGREIRHCRLVSVIMTWVSLDLNHCSSNHEAYGVEFAVSTPKACARNYYDYNVNMRTDIQSSVFNFHFFICSLGWWGTEGDNYLPHVYQK